MVAPGGVRGVHLVCDDAIPILSGTRVWLATGHIDICLAHVLRDVQYAIDSGDTVVAPKIRDHLRWAIRPRGVRIRMSSSRSAMLSNVGASRDCAARATMAARSSFARRGDLSNTAASTNPAAVRRFTARRKAGPVHAPPSDRRRPSRSRTRATSVQGSRGRRVRTVGKMSYATSIASVVRAASRAV